MAITPSARALITLSEYKRLSTDPAVNPAQQATHMDDHYQVLINSISDVIQKHCRRPLIHEDTAEPEEHDGSGSIASLWLKRLPVVIGTEVPFSVTEDGRLLTLDVDFKVRKSNGELIRIRGQNRAAWARGVMNITAAYRAGLWADTASVADDMKVWAAQGVDWLHGLGPASWGSRATEVGLVGPDGMPKPIKDNLNRSYVLPPRV